MQSKRSDPEKGVFALRHEGVTGSSHVRNVAVNGGLS
jgi:hypothetical protein